MANLKIVSPSILFEANVTISKTNIGTENDSAILYRRTKIKGIPGANDNTTTFIIETITIRKINLNHRNCIKLTGVTLKTGNKPASFSSSITNEYMKLYNTPISKARKIIKG